MRTTSTTDREGATCDHQILKRTKMAHATAAGAVPPPADAVLLELLRPGGGGAAWGEPRGGGDPLGCRGSGTRRRRFSPGLRVGEIR